MRTTARWGETRRHQQAARSTATVSDGDHATTTAGLYVPQRNVPPYDHALAELASCRWIARALDASGNGLRSRSTPMNSGARCGQGRVLAMLAEPARGSGRSLDLRCARRRALCVAMGRGMPPAGLQARDARSRSAMPVPRTGRTGCGARQLVIAKWSPFGERKWVPFGEHRSPGDEVRGQPSLYATSY